MAAISDAQIDSILEISGLAAECAGEAHFPPPLLRRMTDLFGSRSCVYYSMSEDLDDHPIWDGFGYNLSGTRIRQYETHYRSLDPCFAGLRLRARVGRGLVVSTNQVIASERRYVASGYYNDFLQPQHIHNSIIFAVGDPHGLLGLFGFHRSRQKPHYGASEHLKARLFATQMAGALRLKKLSDDHARLRALARKFMERASIRDYVVVDGHWRVLDSAGTKAAKLLGPAGTVHVMDESSPSLTLALPKEIKAHCRAVLSDAAGSGGGASASGADRAHRIFENLSGWPRTLVDLLALDDRQPLFLIAFLRKSRELLSRSRFAEFSITPREREIAHEVSQGLTTTQIAYRLKISEKTVEQHLDHMYRKTGTHNRTALIYRLSG